MKNTIKKIINQLGYDVKPLPLTANTCIKAYQKWRGSPWEKGYDRAKIGLIEEAINNPNLLKCFLNQDKLPKQFGIGFDERCIEYPWLFAHLPSQSATLLDAGSVLNFQFLLENPSLKNKKLHILTLAPEKNCFWQKTISYLYDDLRQIPIQNDYYDAIVCLSTLEHIGCDNTLYSKDNNYKENRPNDFIQAVKELRRVLKPNGSLFLSVPFGVYRHFGTFQQFDYDLLSTAITAFGEAPIIKENFYKYTLQGWQTTTAEDCANCKYVEWLANAFEQHRLPKPIPIELDLAAAARGVACVQLVKA